MGGSLKPGDKLPSSRHLEETLGTSRGTLREALRVLEQKGLIEIKVGAKGGIFVREANTEHISEGLGILIRQLHVSLDDLAAFRQVVEGGLIRRVVDRISGNEITRLKGFIPEFERCLQMETGGWDRFLQVELRVRQVLIGISDSLMYAAVLQPIQENIFAYADRYLPGADHLVAEAFDDWKFIIEAISRRETEAASMRTQEHIRRFAMHLENGRTKALAAG